MFLQLFYFLTYIVTTQTKRFSLSNLESYFMRLPYPQNILHASQTESVEISLLFSSVACVGTYEDVTR